MIKNKLLQTSKIRGGTRKSLMSYVRMCRLLIAHVKLLIYHDKWCKQNFLWNL